MSPASGQGGAMAFEDAETLAWTLAHDGGVSARSLPVWAAHRQQRLRQVVAYTIETERRRRPSANWALQKIKELVLWGLLWYRGEAGLSGWVSSYDGEEEMAAICNA
jgi:2-polyprenyl-6-methoxyphenol hydroxylase-like FAD-dependent oxidoreductase